jgi:membrane-bound lytic murein transglycosylase D
LINIYFLLYLCFAGLINAAHAENPLAMSVSLTDPDAPFIPTQELYDEQLTLSTSMIDPEEAAILLTNASLSGNTDITDTGAIWQRLRSGFTLRDLNSTLISRHEQWYAVRPDYIARMMTRANRYLYYIATEVERRGMPGEIALLPMIESGFNPTAYSSANASGIWQFMPATGRDYGLQQNWWYDGRRDIISATTSALDYLQKLHALFGDWELALAAYNWGEGAVQRAQEYNRRLGLPTNYASLKMPDETRNYLPKLFAIRNIISNPARFGLTLPNISDQPYFATVSSPRQIDIDLLARLADISKEEFTALNPAHNRPVIMPHHSNLILLPVDKVAHFISNLDNYDKPLVSWQTYRANKGERLDALAPRFGLSVEKLKAVNGLSAQTSLNAGETLLVPLNGERRETGNEVSASNMQRPYQNNPAIVKLALKTPTRKAEKFAKLTHHDPLNMPSVSNTQISLDSTLTISEPEDEEHFR